MAWDKGSLIGEAKAMQPNKMKQGINSLFLMGCAVFSCPQEVRAQSHMTVAWWDKRHNKMSPFFLCSPLGVMQYGMAYSFG